MSEAEPDRAISTLADRIDADLARAVVTASPDGMLLVDVGGHIAFANEQAARQFGYSLEELQQRTVEDLIPHDLRSPHRRHRDRYGSSPALRPMGAGLELLALRRDGSTFFVDISLSPLTVGDAAYVVAAVRDVSARVAAEDHLHRVLFALDASDDAILVFDADTLRYSHANAGAVRMFGYGQDELATMTPADLCVAADGPDYGQLVRELLDQPGATQRHDVLLRSKDGVVIPVEVHYQAAAPARDGSQWVISVARDVSARMAAEEELARSRQALQEAQQSMLLAEDRSRIARDLHDTVIQRLFGAGLRLQSISTIAPEPVRDRLEETIDELDETIRELRSTIFSLQTSGRSTSGLRRQLLDVVTQAGAASGVDARLQFDGPIDALDDRIGEQLVPALREALANVAKHAHAHHVRVVVAANDHLTMTVTDDGVGIDPGVLGGHGLENLTSRAEQLGGTAEILALPEGGTQVRWRVPTSIGGGRPPDPPAAP